MNLLTLASAREALWSEGPHKIPYHEANVSQKDDFRAKLNEVIEEYMLSGKWRHTVRQFNIPIIDGRITLPRNLSSCLGVRALMDNCSFPLSIYTKYYEFSDNYQCDCTDAVVPMTENAQTFRVPSNGFKLRVQGEADDGKLRLIGGTVFPRFDEFHDYVELPIRSTAMTTQRVYAHMPHIQKPVTAYPVKLYAVDASDNQILIAVYAPRDGARLHQLPRAGIRD